MSYHGKKFMLKNILNLYPVLHFFLKKLLYEISSYVVFDVVEINVLVDYFVEILGCPDFKGVFTSEELVGEDSDGPNIDSMAVLLFSNELGS